MEITLPQISPPQFWPDAYRHIVSKMRELQVMEIGDAPPPSDRAHSLDMDKTGRVERTLVIVGLSSAELDQLHQFEIEKNDFVYNSTQIKKLFKLFNPPTSLSEDIVKIVHDFNEDNRPPPRQWNGMSVPAYFPLDNVFDGMSYHHAWDKSVLANKNKLELPVKSKSKSLKIDARI